MINLFINKENYDIMFNNIIKGYKGIKSESDRGIRYMNDIKNTYCSPKNGKALPKNTMILDGESFMYIFIEYTLFNTIEVLHYGSRPLNPGGHFISDVFLTTKRSKTTKMFKKLKQIEKYTPKWH